MHKRQLTALCEANHNLGRLTKAKSSPEFLAGLPDNLVVCVFGGCLIQSASIIRVPFPSKYLLFF